MYSTQLNKPRIKQLQAGGVSQLFNQGLFLEALLGAHFWDKPNFHPNLVIQTHFALDSPPGMAESQNGLG